MERAAGILLHPTSLPGRFGVGDLGPAADSFLDWAAAAGQRVWQVLPLGPTGEGASPYASQSSHAGNPLLVSPARLVEDGLLPAAALLNTPEFGAGPVDYARAEEWKGGVLHASFLHFLSRGPEAMRDAYHDYAVAPEQEWLAEWGLFCALKAHHRGSPWFTWEPPFRNRDQAALTTVARQLTEEIEFHRYVQFLFDRQWRRVRAEARRRGLLLMGDLPIYVAHDSVDVWLNPTLFQLDEEGRPTFVAGVPPDYFSPTGQRWGNPLYDWERHVEQGYAWWIERLRAALRQADLLRIDHFRGFAAYWEVPAKERTAVNGRWVAGPGDAFFDTVRTVFGGLPIVAEDLGVITPDVEALRRRSGFPGMKVLQFGFGGDDSPHLPHNFTRDTVAYTGTHDNDTVRGWFAALPDAIRTRALAYLGGDGTAVEQEMIRALYASVADLVIVPLQDVLGLGGEARMNTPSVTQGNWRWRARTEQLDLGRALRLRRLAEACHR